MRSGPRVASTARHRITNPVRPAARFFLFVALFLAGCSLAHDAVVTSYHAVTAPVRLVSHQLNKPPGTVTSTTTTSSNSVNPNVPARQTTAATVQRRPPAQPHVATASPSPSPRKSSAQATPKPAPSPKSTPDELSFPTAEAVPDKPGYVFSLSDPSKYVDVSGYAPGSKVKDPYSGKIFLVP
jgi:hypothetical protein